MCAGVHTCFHFQEASWLCEKNTVGIFNKIRTRRLERDLTDRVDLGEFIILVKNTVTFFLIYSTS